jgi:hypothetical protein
MKIVWIAVRYVSWRGFLAGMSLGALYGTGVYPVIGTLFGAICGGIVGLGAGIGCGLVAGLMTLSFFYPPDNSLQLQRVLSLMCAIVAFVAADFGFTQLLGRAFFSGFIPPTLIAAGAAIYVTLGFADRSMSDSFEKPKRKRKETVSNEAGWQSIVW